MLHCFAWAGIAQLVEYKLPKLGVASSNLVARSIPLFCLSRFEARVEGWFPKIMVVDFIVVRFHFLGNRDEVN